MGVTASTIHSPAKGNNGHYARQLWWKRFLLGVPVLLIAFVMLVTWLLKGTGSDYDPDFDGVHITDDHRWIIEKYLTPIRMQIPAALNGPNGRYRGVRAIFCVIDWEEQKKNPSHVPMFKDLLRVSPKCAASKTVVADFYDLVQEAKAFDGFDEGNQKGNNHNGGVFPPNGVVFHETRCGSTLFANLLAGFAPGQSRTYSESPVMAAALTACRTNHCNQETHRALIRDVAYMMGRRSPSGNSEKQTLFYKLQSYNTLFIDKFSMAFPDVPWVFLFRDTVEVMQSHMKDTVVNPARVTKVCTKNMKLPPNSQPVTTMEAIRGAGKKLNQLTEIEYCAAHLAGLSLSAVNEYDRIGATGDSDSPMGRFVDYQSMPNIVWEEILPNHFGVNPLPPKAISNMEELAGVYSKGRGHKKNAEWQEDSTRKKDAAIPEVIEAADMFASKVYNRMKELSAS